jgi:hypothetical protein
MIGLSTKYVMNLKTQNLLMTEKENKVKKP